jgi:hypothetical protein
MAKPARFRSLHFAFCILHSAFRSARDKNAQQRPLVTEDRKRSAPAGSWSKAASIWRTISNTRRRASKATS